MSNSPSEPSDFVLPEQFDSIQNQHLVSALQVLLDEVHHDHPDWNQAVVAHHLESGSHSVAIWAGVHGDGGALHLHPVSEESLRDYLALAEGFAARTGGLQWNVLFARLLPTGEGVAKVESIPSASAEDVGEGRFMGEHFPVRSPEAVVETTQTWGVFGENAPAISDQVESWVGSALSHLNASGQEWVRAALVVSTEKSWSEPEPGQEAGTTHVQFHTHLYAVLGDENSGQFLTLEAPSLDWSALANDANDIFTLVLVPDAHDAASTQCFFTAITSPEDRGPSEMAHDLALVRQWMWNPEP